MRVTIIPHKNVEDKASVYGFAFHITPEDYHSQGVVTLAYRYRCSTLTGFDVELLSFIEIEALLLFITLWTATGLFCHQIKRTKEENTDFKPR